MSKEVLTYARELENQSTSGKTLFLLY